MAILQLIQGPIGRTYFSSMIILILILMTFMSYRLFLSRRKKAYFSLTVSLFIVIIQQFLSIAAETEGPQAEDGWIGYFAQFLKTVSFLLINIGIYQLYNASRKKHTFILILGITGAVAVSMIRFSVDGWFTGNQEQILLFKHIWMELYLFVLLFFCYQWVAPRVGQWVKFQISLTVYFFYQILHVIDLYVIGRTIPALSAFIDFLFVVYYIVLFLILFERVIELLQVSYTKSITDALTGLYNRRYFMNRLQQYIAHGVSVSVIFGDIDNFKKLNDTQGHEKGDEAIKAVSNIMREEAEDVGICSRLGGEEMVVLVTDPDADVPGLAEAIRSRIEAEAGVTVSVGFSRYRKGVSAELLVKQADEAMYQAKTSGKNRVAKYSRQKQLSL